MTPANSRNKPPDLSGLSIAYRGFGSIHRLAALFQSELPELKLEFRREAFMTFYEDFRDRETETDLSSIEDIEPAFYWIKGQNCWIRICFEPHESYYGWRCYASPDKREYYKSYLENTHF